MSVQVTLVSSLISLTVNPALNLRINGNVMATDTQTANLSLLSTLTFTLQVSFEQQLTAGDVVDATLTSLVSLSIAPGVPNGSQFFGFRIGGCIGPTGVAGPTGPGVGATGPTGPAGTGFNVSMSAADPTTVSGGGVLQGWTTDYDTAAGFNAAAGTYTIPSTGTYECFAQVTLVSSLISLTVNPQLHLRVNGAAVSTWANTVSLSLLSTLTFSMGTNFQLQLTAGNVVDVELTSLVSLAVATGVPTGSLFTINRIA